MCLKCEDLKLKIKNFNMMVAALEEDNAVSVLKEDNAAAVTLMEDSNTRLFCKMLWVTFHTLVFGWCHLMCSFKLFFTKKIN